jgi:hypothetical protein
LGRGEDPANRGNRTCLLAGDVLISLSTSLVKRCVGRRRGTSQCVPRTKMCPNLSVCSYDRQHQSADLQAFQVSPLTDSNRRPPPYHAARVFADLSPFRRLRFATDCDQLQPRGSMRAPSDNRQNGLVRGRRSCLERLRWRRLRTIGARHATDRMIARDTPVVACRRRAVRAASRRRRQRIRT